MSRGVRSLTFASHPQRMRYLQKFAIAKDSRSMDKGPSAAGGYSSGGGGVMGVVVAVVAVVVVEVW